MNRSSGIYKIQSMSNPEKIYVGSAVSFYVRWSIHQSELRLNKHKNSKLQNYYNKYGSDDLQYMVIQECDKEELLKLEQHYIDTLNPYFNICKIAGSSLGLKRSDETKKKIGDHWRGTKHSEQHKINISNGLKGHKNSLGHKDTEETLQKKSEKAKGNTHGFQKGSAPWNKGKKGLQEAWNKGITGEASHMKGKIHNMMTDETKQKISESLKGRTPWNKGVKGKQTAWNKGLKMDSPSWNKGKHHTEEHKQKLKDAWVKRKLNQET